MQFCPTFTFFPVQILHKNFPCQLYDLTNPSLFHVQHLDQSCVQEEGRKHCMSLDMILLISLFDVRHVEHNDVQYQGKALSVVQSYQQTEISGWFVCNAKWMDQTICHSINM